MLLDETREPSWETEGTFYSIAGVGHVYALTTSLACCSIFVSIGLKKRHDNSWLLHLLVFTPFKTKVKMTLTTRREKYLWVYFVPTTLFTLSSW